MVLRTRFFLILRQFHEVEAIMHSNQQQRPSSRLRTEVFHWWNSPYLFIPFSSDLLRSSADSHCWDIKGESFSCMVGIIFSSKILLHILMALNTVSLTSQLFWKQPLTCLRQVTVELFHQPLPHKIRPFSHDHLDPSWSLLWRLHVSAMIEVSIFWVVI